MSKPSDGGPAFPQTSNEQAHTNPGMSLRDWFAGQAMIELCRASVEQTVDRYKPDQVAGDAYTFADAMVAERNRT